MSTHTGSAHLVCDLVWLTERSWSALIDDAMLLPQFLDVLKVEDTLPSKVGG